MSCIYKPMLEAVHAAVKAQHSATVIGFLPPDGGIAIQMMGGEVESDMAGNRYVNLKLQIAAKCAEQSAVVTLLEKAQDAVERMRASGTGWSIYGAHTSVLQSLAAQDAQGRWIMTTQARVKGVKDGE